MNQKWFNIICFSRILNFYIALAYINSQDTCYSEYNAYHEKSSPNGITATSILATKSVGDNMYLWM